MLNRSPMWFVRTLATLLLLCVPASLLQAQEYIPTPQELEQLLAPVALYPDALLAQITSASTNPQEILDVDDWLHQNAGLSGVALTNAAQAQGFDPAFIALVNFPQVIDMMAQNIDDYAAIGAAFEHDQSSVMDAVQNLREDAYQAGGLHSGPQQRIVVESSNGRQIILIEPANPQVVYIPQYNPAVVYGFGGPGAAAWITFGAGISLGLALASNHPWGWSSWGWNWHQRRLIYNHLFWRSNFNRYRPPRPIYRPSRPNFGNRPVIRPPRPSPGKPGRPPARPTPGKPAIQPVRPRPTPGKPAIQPVRPQPTPGKPSIHPVRPSPEKPAVRPTRPTNGVRPAPIPSKPRPEPRPTPNRPAQPRPDQTAQPARPNNGGARPAPRPQQPQKQPPPKPRPEDQPQ